jgi:hypothetical protein
MRIQHGLCKPNQGRPAEHTQKTLPNPIILNKIQNTSLQIEQSSKRLFPMRALVSFWKKIDFSTLLM